MLLKIILYFLSGKETFYYNMCNKIRDEFEYMENYNMTKYISNLKIHKSLGAVA